MDFKKVAGPIRVDGPASGGNATTYTQAGRSGGRSAKVGQYAIKIIAGSSNAKVGVVPEHGPDGDVFITHSTPLAPTAIPATLPGLLIGDAVRRDIETGAFEVGVGVDSIDAVAFGDSVEGHLGIVAGDHPGGVNAYLATTSGKQAFTFGNMVHMGEHEVLNAALADYYLWWAWRLYSYGEDNGDQVAQEIAGLCAKAGLAEIAEIASLLVHEYSHFSGGYWEDYEPIQGRCVNCCHYLSGYVFLHGVLAKLGLPLPTVVGRDNVIPGEVGGKGAGGRFDFGDEMGWQHLPRGFRSKADACDGTYSASHCEFWAAGHAATVSWTTDAASCWNELDGLESADSFALRFDGAGCSR